MATGDWLTQDWGIRPHYIWRLFRLKHVCVFKNYHLGLGINGQFFYYSRMKLKVGVKYPTILLES